jgi:peptide/nickel transport system permease protein
MDSAGEPVEPPTGAAARPNAAAEPVRAVVPAGSPIVGTVRRLFRSRKGIVGAGFLLGLLVVAAVGPLIAPYDPNELHGADQLAPPSATYLFGTDELGRDILSRVIVGARPAIEAGILAVTLAGVVGCLTGLAAGYFGGWLDVLIGRLLDTLLSFPAIFLAIGIATILGAGQLTPVLAIAIISMPVSSRLVRAVTVSARNSEYVEAARTLGCSDWRVMVAHIMPNCVAPLIVQMAIAAPDAILVEASLSFLGLGTPLPAATWGNMLGTAQTFLARSWTYAIFPGLAITLTVVGLNYFADALQDAIDPRRIRATASNG